MPIGGTIATGGRPTGAAASAGGSTGGATPVGGAGDVPPGGLPAGFPRGSSGGRHRCPTASHPTGRGARSARGLPAPPDASLLQAGRQPTTTDAAPVLSAFSCAACT
ncbi:uncharacterized protein LOC135673912 [Musa acuminata AAA Group]|uniref:uncharacterized protein LOC135673912 n=1 Tax=Musa acuminata AAA Group TaxID=214697 RepID=UPI0031D54491